MFKRLIIKLLWVLGKILSYFYPYKANKLVLLLRDFIYSAWISREFKFFGKGSVIHSHCCLVGGQYISIGNKSSVGARAVLTAWDRYGSGTFLPKISIGNYASIGDDSHITAINRIEIGNYVLTGKKITITDNVHGKSNLAMLSIPPSIRPLFSEGPVIIEDGVWIGDKVTILSNVRIGRNAIIGANAVVTSDIPANSVAVGVPAKVIKIIES